MDKQLMALASDENTMVMWDMDALLADYRENPGICVETKKLIPRQWLTIDPQYAMSTDVTVPIILFELPDNRLFIADGNHRIYRAATEHIPAMQVIVLPQEQHLNYLFSSTEEDYHRVIAKLQAEDIFILHF